MAGAFEGKVALITGAAHGQGRAAAKAFAREGARVAGFDLARKIDYPAYAQAGSAALQSLHDEIAGGGGGFLPLAGDVRSEVDVRGAVARTIDAFGRIDVVFGNAGIAAYGYAHELDEAEWDAVIDINLKGNWLLAKHVIPHLRVQGSGVVIFNSSIAGLRGLNRLSHYSRRSSAGGAGEVARHRACAVQRAGADDPSDRRQHAHERRAGGHEGATRRRSPSALRQPACRAVDRAGGRGRNVLFLASDKSRYVTGSGFVLDAGLLTR